MARLTTIDFEGIAPTNGFVRYYNPGGFSQSGVTFTTNNTSLVVVDTGFSSSYYDWGSGALLQAGESPGEIGRAHV